MSVWLMADGAMGGIRIGTYQTSWLWLACINITMWASI